MNLWAAVRLSPRLCSRRPIENETGGGRFGSNRAGKRRLSPVNEIF